MERPNNDAACRVADLFLKCLGERNDINRLMALISKDIVVSTPFAPDGQLTEFRGQDQVLQRFAGSRQSMKEFSFSNVDIIPTQRQGLVIATCRSSGQHVDGRPYSNEYCWLFQIEKGQITWWCEYYDPQKLMPFLNEIQIG
jgi:ketosteroid isomerase-like protein